MEAIILEQDIIADKDLYDIRHFYFDNERVGHSTCGMAFQTIMDIYRQHDAPSHDIGSWYRAICNSPNHIVLGYLAVYICLDTIRRDGMGTVDEALDGTLVKETFDTVPDVERLITEHASWSRLYVPNSFNFPNVDAAIVCVDRHKQQAFVYLIQVTLATAHKNSETDFYQTQWEGWKSSFPSKYEVFPTFVCIAGPRVKKGVPQAPTDIVPEPRRVHLSIEYVNRRLHDMIARTGF